MPYCAERGSVCLRSTGTEAVQIALRIARAVTGRRGIIKFLGHYHGWFDSVNLGSYGETGPTPGSAGQDPQAMASTIVCGWNDIHALGQALDDDVAAVIMEPINVDGGCLHADPSYLTLAERLIHENGSLLIFDEVITGYRVALGGAQQKLGSSPDLTVLGKALGGGFPISAVAGKAELMAVVADGRVAHAGTYNGNPVSAAAALAVVRELEQSASDVYPRLDRMMNELADMLEEATAHSATPLSLRRETGVGHAFVSARPVLRYSDTLSADREAYRRFTAEMLDQGVHLMPKGILYVSTAHSAEDLEFTYHAAVRAARSLAEATAESGQSEGLR